MGTNFGSNFSASSNASSNISLNSLCIEQQTVLNNFIKNLCPLCFPPPQKMKHPKKNEY